MSEPRPSPEQPRCWWRWACGLAGLALILALVRFGYPAVRLQRAVNELRHRGFHVTTQSVFGPSWSKWAGAGWGDAFSQAVDISTQANTCTDDDMTVLGELIDLTYDGFREPGRCALWLGRTQVTDVGLRQLRGLTKLHQLGLESPHITDEGLVHLWHANRLEALILVGTKVTPEGLKKLKATLPAAKIIGS